MKNYFKIKRLTVLLLIIIFTIASISCSEDPSITSFENDDSAVMGEKESEFSSSNNTIEQIPHKALYSGGEVIRLHTDEKLKALYSGEESVIDSDYPQTASCTVGYFKNWGYYKGSVCHIPNGSFFEISHGALVPPENIPLGDEVNITMHCDKDPVSGELIFSFGPSGCQFDPPAKVWLDWSDLGSPNATLYYLKEDGGREEQLPDQIDVNNKHMCIYIDHFSRYAVAYSN